jgi:hypothetical protein
MKPSEVINHLTHKLKILEEIQVNTEKQCRFVRKGEMRGLRRLLSERAVLISDLFRLNGELAGEHSRNYPPGSEKLLEDIAAKKLEILGSCDRVLQEALAAREQIGDQLRDVRRGRQLQHQYVNRWTVPEQGNCFNKRG